jgi:hypothetical protein
MKSKTIQLHYYKKRWGKRIDFFEGQKIVLMLEVSEAWEICCTK